MPPALEQSSTSGATTARSTTTPKAVYQRYLGWFDGNPAHLHRTRPSRPPPGTSSTWAAPAGAGQDRESFAAEGITGGWPRS